MIKTLLYKAFGTRNDRLLKQYRQLVNQINDLESEFVQLSDEALRNKTSEFRKRYQQNADLDGLLVEAFATCREASKRTLGMRHFDVQLIGGIVLHQGKIAEMRTGEGKTLVGTLGTYLNAIAGNGVHVVTVNDYLAKRDALELKKLYDFLDVSVGINLPDLSPQQKRAAYACDITYGTNNEFGFDYLRDNMVFDKNDKVQRGLNFAIVDEVDSILIDEARTPLIISGMGEGSEELYIKLDQVPSRLVPQEVEESAEGDFWVDEKNHNVILSDKGHEKVEQILIDLAILAPSDSLYNIQNINLVHHLLAAMKAHYVYKKDQHYVVQNGEILIVDEFTGRLMAGRRWSDGLHQAVEAKERVDIQKENQTMASITLQNYFRMYAKLAGMTGTADTEAFEFQDIYKLETVIVPTNKPMIRIDYNDKIYMNLTDKYNAIVEEIKLAHAKGQPVLVGTTSVENSEVISELLTKAKLKHEVLNAKQHAREAEIITQAGSHGAITVATNMAGRGTDIILGGSYKPALAKINQDESISMDEKNAQIAALMQQWQLSNTKVLECGGLFIIGTERHESRRIDNQLRGRSGRQGDIGASRFFLSLDDPLLRIFGGDKMRGAMQRLGMKPGESIEHKWLSRSIESAQRKVEAHNYDIRKQLLEYDDVANDQRRVIYKQRDEILYSQDLSEISLAMIAGVINHVCDKNITGSVNDEQEELTTLTRTLKDEFNVDISELNLTTTDLVNKINLSTKISQLAIAHYKAKLQLLNEKIKFDMDNFLDNITNSDLAIDWDIDALIQVCIQNRLAINDTALKDAVKLNPEISRDEFKNYFYSIVGDITKQHIANFECGILLQNLDYHWKEHLNQLEHLREGIHLRGYAQKDPKQEYKYESFSMFSTMLDNIKYDIVKGLLTIPVYTSEPIQPKSKDNNQPKIVLSQISSVDTAPDKLGRNNPCPCGSGKKYKHCCGKLN